MLSNREPASLLILLGGGAFVSIRFRATVVPAVRTLVRQLLAPLLLVPLACLVVYIISMVRLCARFGPWDRTMLFGTVVWFVTVALTSYLNIGSVLRAIGAALLCLADGR